ncbi:amidase [Methylobacterium sp. WL8]|nr:amidase [Methylobacterium sp. WL8]
MSGIMTDTGDDLADLSATELAKRIAGKTVSPVEAVEAMLARIDAREPKLQAFTEVFADDARLAAEGADRAIRSGHSVGPLHGVPIALKDLIDIEGRITMGGSAAHRARRAACTATIARRLIAQGMIVLGKTHTVEFAYGGWGTNQHLGTPWNPWDLETPRTPGGSSSGTGVAVAARMAPWGIGTDTGGSVRLPAAFCGLTGLKVTVGRVSTHGIVPLSATLDTPGPLARSVADAALLYAAISGPDPLDPATRGILTADPFPTLHRGVRGLRLARMPEAERTGCSAEMLSAYDTALDVLSGLGAEVVDLALPFRFSDLVAMSGITNAEAYFVNGALAEDAAAPLGDAVRARILGGRSLSAQDYLATLQRRDALKRDLALAWEGVDAILTPTTETAAVPLAEVDELHMPSRFTRFANLLDLCGLSLPNGFSQDGLPLSLQIVCRGYDEAMALRIGQAFQGATAWHLRAPTGF